MGMESLHRVEEVGGQRLEAKAVFPQTSSEALLKPQTAGQILVATNGLRQDLPTITPF
jgi:hypothetical protein